MSYLSKKNNHIKKLNKSNNRKKYTKLLKKHISIRDKELWLRNGINIPRLQKWHKTLYSPNNVSNSNLSNIPNKIFIMKRSLMGINDNSDFFFRKMTKKDKQIMVSKLIETEESKNTYKLRKINIKKQILNNIILRDLRGEQIILGDYYKDHSKINNVITVSDIIKIVRKKLKLKKHEKIELNLDPKFKIDFKAEKYRQGFLYNLRFKPFYIYILGSI